MDHILKFIRRLKKSDRLRIEAAISRIIAQDLYGMDIKKLQGVEGLWRCRIGNIRIIFRRDGKNAVILEVAFRSKAYRSL